MSAAARALSAVLLPSGLIENEQEGRREASIHGSQCCPPEPEASTHCCSAQTLPRSLWAGRSVSECFHQQPTPLQLGRCLLKTVTFLNPAFQTQSAKMVKSMMPPGKCGPCANDKKQGSPLTMWSWSWTSGSAWGGFLTDYWEATSTHHLFLHLSISLGLCAKLTTLNDIHSFNISSWHVLAVAIFCQCVCFLYLWIPSIFTFGVLFLTFLEITAEDATYTDQAWRMIPRHFCCAMPINSSGPLEKTNQQLRNNSIDLLT